MGVLVDLVGSAVVGHLLRICEFLWGYLLAFFHFSFPCLLFPFLSFLSTSLPTPQISLPSPPFYTTNITDA